MLVTLIVLVSVLPVAATEGVAGDSNSLEIFSYSDRIQLESVDVSHDGSYIAAGSVSSDLMLLNHVGELLWRKNLNSRIVDFSFTDDGGSLYALTRSGSIMLINPEGDIVWEENIGSDIISHSFSVLGEYLAVGSDKVFLFGKDGLIWSSPFESRIDSVSVAEDGSGVCVITGCKCCYLNGDGDLLWSKSVGGAKSAVSWNGDVCVGGTQYPIAWNKDGLEIWRYPQNASQIHTYAFSPRDNSFFGANNDQQVFSFDFVSYVDTSIWSLDGYPLNYIHVLPSGDQFAAASDSILYLFNSKGNLIYVYKNSKPLRDFSFSDDVLYVAYVDGALHFVSTKPSAISIDSSPQGAEVFVNGSVAGTTPFTLSDLREGAYPITLNMDGYEESSEVIRTKAGETSVFSTTLSRGPGDLAINSTPKGAYVYLDNEYYGVSPCVIESLPEGSYFINIEMDGYLNSSGQVQVVAFETVEFNLTLTERPPEMIALPTISGLNPGFIFGGGILFCLLIGGVVVYMKRRSPPVPVGNTITRSKNTRSSKRHLYESLPREFPEKLMYLYSDSEYLGKGGFGMVFKATRISDGKEVAIKFPLEMDPETGKSFLKEIKSWGELKHKNIVELYDINILPIPYFEMEYIDSGSIEEMKKPINAREAARIIFDVAEGLKFAHSKGIVHRDLKPHNVLINELREPKIMDWGLSKVESHKKTSTMIAISPLYAAPEQVSSDKFGNTDSRTDLYQLGIIFYELVTGHLPYNGSGVAEISTKIIFEDPALPSSFNPELKPLDDIIMKCLRKNKDERYQKAADLQADVGAYLDIELKQTMKKSLSLNNTGKAVYYCADLIMINLKMGDLPKAYSYILDIIRLIPEDKQKEFTDLSKEIGMSIEYGVDEVSDDLLIRSEVLIHQLLMDHI
ncbi:protein kinase domain-containing protein [Methanoplanus endosymbiosus]|uniref:PEGA domain-containing protein n=1 Tax=Methanoplanus endosymbiosus TaxID=33865 RepID=A0A9E7TLE2_9EURY|nr:PEGA domain-containing protein [Methanoplanus endosymbiosus]UUX93734.1 PEGA domain-containing protein [Methanoplanus endosymbiosus]